MKVAGVIGGGAWGTALAQVCARAGLDVLLWAREPEVVGAIARDRQNPLFLPGVTLDAAVAATTTAHDLLSTDALDVAARPRWPLDEAAARLNPTHIAGRKGAKA